MLGAAIDEITGEEDGNILGVVDRITPGFVEGVLPNGATLGALVG